MSELLILIEGELAGRVVADKSGRLSLSYEKAWRESPQSHSLSVNMPLAQITYPHKSVWPYLWNLLPENPNVLQRWAQQYHVSAGNPFKLLTHVGADTPGAAQFISPELRAEIQSEQHPVIEWISMDELRRRLIELRADASAMRRPGDVGKMSLPGAQAKTAFYWDREKNPQPDRSCLCSTSRTLQGALSGSEARGARSTQLSFRGTRWMHQLGKAAPLRPIPAAHQPQTPGDY